MELSSNGHQRWIQHTEYDYLNSEKKFLLQMKNSVNWHLKTAEFGTFLLIAEEQVAVWQNGGQVWIQRIK